MANICLYIPILRKLRNTSLNVKKNVQTRLFLYVLTFSFCVLPGMINRLQHIFYPNPVFALCFIQCLTFPIQGFLNSLIYSKSKMMKTEIRKYWKRPKSEEEREFIENVSSKNIL